MLHYIQCSELTAEGKDFWTNGSSEGSNCTSSGALWCVSNDVVNTLILDLWSNNSWALCRITINRKFGRSQLLNKYGRIVWGMDIHIFSILCLKSQCFFGSHHVRKHFVPWRVRSMWVANEIFTFFIISTLLHRHHCSMLMEKSGVGIFLCPKMHYISNFKLTL